MDGRTSSNFFMRAELFSPAAYSYFRPQQSSLFELAKVHTSQTVLKIQLRSPKMGDRDIAISRAAGFLFFTGIFHAHLKHFPAHLKYFSTSSQIEKQKSEIFRKFAYFCDAFRFRSMDLLTNPVFLRVPVLGNFKRHIFCIRLS